MKNQSKQSVQDAFTLTEVLVTNGLSRLYIDRYRNMANNIAGMDGSDGNVKLLDLWKQKRHSEWKAPKHVHGFGLDIERKE